MIKYRECFLKAFFLLLLIHQIDSKYIHQSINDWQEVSKFVSSEEIQTTSSDNRQYQAVVLKNGLKVFLISDPNITFSSVNLKIQSKGYDEDNEELPGLLRLLRHYTERKVLKGYHESLISFLGNLNCSLMSSNRQGHTMFHFKLNYIDNIPQSLARLSEAVKFSGFDLEHVKNLTNDMQHEHKLLTENDYIMVPYIRAKIFLMPQGERSLSSASDYGFFIRKNLFDLASKAKLDLIDKLGELQKNLYAANNMFLVIWAPENLGNLTRMAIDNFSTIPTTINAGGIYAKKASKLIKPENIVRKRQAGMAIKMAGHHKLPRIFDAQFMNRNGLPIPDDIQKFFRHCLNQGFGGSKRLSDFLIAHQSFCSDVLFSSFGVKEEFYGFSCFLTDLGMKNYQLVLKNMFRHVNYAKKYCLTNGSMYDQFYASNFEEFNNQKRIEKADEVVFQMDETFPSAENIKKLVTKEVKVPKIPDFSETIQKYVSLFDAENLIFVLSDSNWKGKLAEIDPLTLVEYSASKIDEKQLKIWNRLEPATDQTFELINQ